jgi:ectoine hydroxylase-related dioxygenase (phytanoyl-CoA dioxygenase family)
MMRSNGAPIGGLSHTQARFFQDEGYFRLLDVFNDQEVAQLKAFVLAEKAREDARRHAAGEGPTIKLYGLYGRNPELIGSVIRHPKLVAALWSLLGPNVVFVTNRHNHTTVNDAAGTKDEARLHRDILQPTRGLLTAAVYLEESTLENGCTRILPGSHTLPYVGVPQPDGGGTWMSEHEEYEGLEDQAVPVAMPAGSVLLFTGLAFHGVGLNTSRKTRVSMTLGFRAVDEIDAMPDNYRQIVATGSHLYRGNDIH